MRDYKTPRAKGHTHRGRCGRRCFPQIVTTTLAPQAPLTQRFYERRPAKAELYGFGAFMKEVRAYAIGGTD